MTEATVQPPTSPPPSAMTASAPELSVVIPCLDEADTLGTCIHKALRAMRDAGIDGEVIVADNGSTDASRQIAIDSGASLVDVAERGYGSALRAGINAARGRYVIMGDADDSYDFLEIPKFVQKLRAGDELVQGCRLPAGGGRVDPGAMPLLHRWWGNPLFTLLARWWFRAPVNDVYCGMRGFRRDLIERLDLRCGGMAFAIEMIVKASRSSARIGEVPITLHRDGRIAHPPHLKTFRDGWRTLRFFLIHSPRWLFLQPGKILILLGLIGYAMALPGAHLGGVEIGLHTLVFASAALLCGQQAILFAIGAKAAGAVTGLLGPDPRISRFYRVVTLERGVVAGLSALALGGGLLLAAVIQWHTVHYGHLNYDVTMRWVIPGATLVASGFQAILASFLLTILRGGRE